MIVPQTPPCVAEMLLLPMKWKITGRSITFRKKFSHIFISCMRNCLSWPLNSFFIWSSVTDLPSLSCVATFFIWRYRWLISDTVTTMSNSDDTSQNTLLM